MAITAWSAKVCSKLDLLVAERMHFGAAEHDDADALAFAQQRHAEDGAMAQMARSWHSGKFVTFDGQISCTCTGFCR